METASKRIAELEAQVVRNRVHSSSPVLFQPLNAHQASAKSSAGGKAKQYETQIAEGRERAAELEQSVAERDARLRELKAQMEGEVRLKK